MNLIQEKNTKVRKVLPFTTIFIY